MRKLLINERDRDVLALLKSTVETLDRINCLHETMHARRNLTDEDIVDQKRADEEQLLLDNVS